MRAMSSNERLFRFVTGRSYFGVPAVPVLALLYLIVPMSGMLPALLAGSYGHYKETTAAVAKMMGRQPRVDRFD